MTAGRHITTAIIDWQGMSLSVDYEPDWLNMGRASAFSTAHLQIRTINPERAPLPFTETGYRSHFLSAEAVDQAGGPVAYVTAWLEHDAALPEWRKRLAEWRQLSLF